MNIEAVIKCYDRYSSIYDAIFHPFFFRGRRDVIGKLNLEKSDHILEIGIGTGASLPLYPNDTKVTGIDISEKMLFECHKRIEKKDISNVTLEVMNAECLNYPNNHFSHVVAMYVMSVSPNPNIVLEELNRVCKSGGEIVVLNHFSHDESLISRLERLITPLSSKLGFKPYFPLQKFVEHMSFWDIYEVEKTNFWGYWSIIRAKKAG
jgi:phosphatidylethanolamine/phosphatidyl-N-methylethanolamine N-methyltransferase